VFPLPRLSEDSTRHPCRFSVSFFDAPLSCLTWFLPFLGCARTASWVRPSPSILRNVRMHWILGFSACNSRSPSDLRSPTPTFGCTSETGVECLGFVLLAARIAALRRLIANATHPTGAGCCSSSPRLLELCRPSGGVIAGVRSTRDCHPRHLPPLIFLRSSTACTSRRLAMFSFTQAPPMGFKEPTKRFVASLAVLTGPSEDGPARDHEDRTCSFVPRDSGSGFVVAREKWRSALK